jgi:hypothetical protein
MTRPCRYPNIRPDWLIGSRLPGDKGNDADGRLRLRPAGAGGHRATGRPGASGTGPLEAGRASRLWLVVGEEALHRVIGGPFKADQTGRRGDDPRRTSAATSASHFLMVGLSALPPMCPRSASDGRTQPDSKAEGPPARFRCSVGLTSMWWRVKGSNLRSLRDRFTVCSL